MFEKTLENSWDIILNRLVPDAEFTISEIEGTWYDKLEMENKPTLEQFEAEFQVYLNELLEIEEARLAEIARIEDIKTRWENINPFKRECFIELGYSHVPNLEAEFFIPEILNAHPTQAENVLIAFENKKVELVNIKNANLYKELRAKEYPSYTDYMDGFAKSKSSDSEIAAEGVAQMEKYAQDCLAVKAKYPKGN